MQIGPLDYNIYTNSQLRDHRGDQRAAGQDGRAVRRCACRDIGYAKDAQQIQTNVVRVDGQRSVYVPVLKQGGDTNTIAVVDGIKAAVKHLFDVPQATDHARWCSINRVFVKTAIETLLHEGAIGLFLTSMMILIFLGSMRATVAVFFSIPLSALAAFIALSLGGGSVNSMVLGGLALAFSRLIDNSVVVLENIYRHLELGEIAGGRRGKRRARSGAAGARGDADHGGRVLPGDISVRRQQVSVYRAGAGGGALAVRFLRGGDDGGAAVLRALHQSAGASRHAFDEVPVTVDHAAGRSAPSATASTSGSTTASNRFCSVYDRLVAGVLRRPGADAGGVRRRVRR